MTNKSHKDRLYAKRKRDGTDLISMEDAVNIEYNSLKK